MNIRKAEPGDTAFIHKCVLLMDRDGADRRQPVVTERDIELAGFADDPLFEAFVAAVDLRRDWSRIELCVDEGRPAFQFYETIGMTDCRQRRCRIEGDDLVRLADRYEG